MSKYMDIDEITELFVKEYEKQLFELIGNRPIKALNLVESSKDKIDVENLS